MHEWPSVTAEQIVSKAREYIGTPFHHGGRVKGVGIDCAGLIVCVFRDLGITLPDVRQYRLASDNSVLILDGLKECADPVFDPPLLPGDMILRQTREMPSHCMIYAGDGRVIHAYSSRPVPQVIETDCYQGTSLPLAWRYKGLR